MSGKTAMVKGFGMLSSIEFGRTAAGKFFWGKLPDGEELAKVDGDKWTTAGGMASVDGVISSDDMVVFSMNGCPFCEKAIAALQDAGYAPTVVVCDSTQRQWLASKCGSKSVPKVFVKGQFVGGCNDGGLGGVLPLLSNGKIKELMGK
eukprot:gnl/TRDRNA2_/TRDRNA2_100121_c0_seq1.p1 gnl/TRDRNA2_/TRDRNA2_100121_c0~~gnl/TRDRNA2_/TRDRNA2_100121_c0_seq1.p1  ORF type:complete len:148 (+),score=33.90 gnl/TRDRNA2_/TRDRNA2_100121_c0_seq1:201-644(+)